MTRSRIFSSSGGAQRDEMLLRIKNGEDLKPPPAADLPPLWFSNKVTQDLFRSETPDVLAEVEEYRNDPTAGEEDDPDNSADEFGEPTEKEDVAKARSMSR